MREGLFKFTKHTTDLDFAQCLTYSTNLFQRLTLDELWNNSGKVVARLKN